MKHARPDYDRFQDPAGIIPEDEPVFLLRGQDRFAAATVRWYADLIEAEGADPEMVRLCRVHADRMQAWRPRKFPDVPSAARTPGEGG